MHHLLNKARDTNYLAHMERVTLLYTFGHLGEEGKGFLHRVIGYCLNYNYDFTERQIRKIKESPISCARIREIHENILLSTGCPCRIKPPPKGYSSPVLYAYRKGFNPQEKIKDREPGMDRTSLAPTPSSEPSKEQSINTVLKRYIELRKQQRGVERNLKECEGKMCEILSPGYGRGIQASSDRHVYPGPHQSQGIKGTGLLCG